jgi:pimeloyl-ACP methyl ester carboxylesterase
LALKERPLADIPLLVLTRGEADDGTAEGKASWRIWKELHGELARESTRGEQEIVPGSGHFIQVDRPAAVIQAIRRLWDQFQQKAFLLK